MYLIKFGRRAAKEFKKLPSHTLKRASKAIDDLAENPRPEGSKKLKGSDEEFWRIRIGDYRVIYLIEDNIKIIEVERVAHRKDVYKL